MRFFPHLLYVILLYASVAQSQLHSVKDIKEFKKLLRTKNNVLVHFFSEDDRDLLDTLSRVSESVKGLATIVRINCSKDAKLCKKINKESPDLPSLKHYYKGEFHLDYNRALKAKSLVTFLKDPTGDLPWDEDPGSKGVIHLRTPSELNKLVSRGERALIMFYAPWCGFCKRLKPVYERAASLLEPRDGAMAAMDVNAPVNAPIRQKYNISAFPTLIFFEGGRDRYAYPGRNDAESFVKFMKDPSPEELIVPEVNVPLGWKDEGGDTMVVHLEEDNFDESIASEKSFNVMFYAPWCGHCKNLKPHYNAASKRMSKESIEGKLGAVDCTTQKNLCQRFQIKGYPTLKYFKNGEFAFNSGHVKDEKSLIEFMKSPFQAPPPDPSWEEEESIGTHVFHLSSDYFKTFLKKKKHALVIFYAPWCGHCKRAKPEFEAAAKAFKDNPRVAFAALDCTSHQEICKRYGVSGYPSFKYYSYYNKNGSPSEYKDARSTKGFTNFILSKIEELETLRNEL